MLWLLPDALYSAFTQWLNGQQLVKPTIPITLVFVLYNAGANYLLVHGGLGFEGLGFIGSPIATATTKVFQGVALVWCVRAHAPAAKNELVFSPSPTPAGTSAPEEDCTPSAGLLGRGRASPPPGCGGSWPKRSQRR